MALPHGIWIITAQFGIALVDASNMSLSSSTTDIFAAFQDHINRDQDVREVPLKLYSLI